MVESFELQRLVKIALVLFLYIFICDDHMMQIFYILLNFTYDKVPRNVMWWALEKHKVPTKYITLIKDMYKNAMMFVRTYGGDH